jgi:hypothetical protein
VPLSFIDRVKMKIIILANLHNVFIHNTFIHEVYLPMSPKKLCTEDICVRELRLMSSIP